MEDSLYPRNKRGVQAVCLQANQISLILTYEISCPFLFIKGMYAYIFATEIEILYHDTAVK